MLNNTNPPCPHLPKISEALPITHTRAHRAECGEAFYIACLELAQSLWIEQRPAQSILQLDKAMMAQIPANSSLLDDHPIPYQAMIWLMKNTSTNGSFMGNPVRHFQHLASRMNQKQPQPELRIARAWACLHLAESILDSENHPRDHQQIHNESLKIPTINSVVSTLVELSPHPSEIEWISYSLKVKK